MTEKNKPRRDVLGVYDVRGIPITVWITREPAYNNDVSNFLNAENKQYELKYKSEIYATIGRSNTHSDELTARIKQAHADGNLSITLYDHKNLFVTTDNPIYKKQVILVLHSCMDYGHIQEVLYKKQIADLEAKVTDLESKIAELEKNNKLEAKVTDLESKIAELEKNNKLESKIVELEKKHC